MAEPPPDPRFSGWLTAIKGLTITNVLVIALLIVVLAPAYLLYRAVNDEKLMDRFLSSYREMASQQSGCTLRVARERGSPNQWGISTGFAYQGSDRWMVSVVLDHEPNADEIQSYCATLYLLIDFMRDPAARSPSFPGTDDPVVRQYENTP